MGTKKEETSVIEVKNKEFDLQTLEGDLGDAISEEMDGLGAIPFDKIKFPLGGSLAFEMPGETDDETTSATELTGVIVDHHPLNAYWKDPYSGGNAQPDCSSYDGKTGVDTESGEIRDCKNCPYNQYGSDSEGSRGKACKNVHRIYMLREGSPVPMLLSLPPTSLRYFRDYLAKKILLKGMRCWDAITKITLKKEKNSTGIPYSRACFAFEGRLTPEQSEKTAAMSTVIKQSIRSVPVVDEADYNSGNKGDTKDAEFQNVPDGVDADLPFS